MSRPTSSLPLISVVMPVYNGGAFISSAIESILNQTEDNFEFLIIDDASKDNSSAIIRDYQEKDSRIIAIENKENQGVSSARNRALKQAKGQYIALMDCDDICVPERFSNQIQRMQHQNLDICGASIQFFGDKERTKIYPEHNDQIKLNLFCDAPSIATPTAMFRKKLFTDTYFDPNLNFGEDIALYIRLALEKRAKFGNCPEPLLKYRIHERQSSQQFLDRKHHLFTHVFYQLLQHYTPEITIEDLSTHYALIKKRHILSSQTLGQYARFLKQLNTTLNISETTDSEYWSRFCSKHLKSSRSVAALYKALSSKTQKKTYIKLYLEGLAMDLTNTLTGKKY